MKKFVLIDGNALIHRGFHAIPPLFTKGGEMINAVFGFTTVLLGVLQKEVPDYIAVTFDKKGPTHRHAKYAEYKATRVKAPDELYAQIPRIKEVVSVFGIPIFEESGFEADDVIATLVTKLGAEQDINVVIVTGDKDTLQLVNDCVSVGSPRKGYHDVFYYTPASVFEKLGVRPEQVLDYKGLCGDPSDNIPGVMGIGPKTATDLLAKYETLDGIYEHLEDLSPKTKEKLEKGRESALFSKDLSKLVSDMKIDLDIESCSVDFLHYADTEKIFEKLEFKSLINRLRNLEREREHYKQDEEFKKNQPSLF
ncbi:MAG: polymerase I, DNA polymerase I protein [Candidatus Peregrinibacteria bacterium GW2011_GWF2_43_17]|nr:MAG: polymerase I, DNA polymerase I protein [Candidatus Peregrinibacteria bacterium GW2011_GWF2_43_17]KKT19191.1 MAG: polymerase protein [Candidatus Peregrinibacteria bacterium GW2011_GWA2_43_8]HAU39598.1 hypothetical protein [Candidatus Peregrinibacteria bacterium]